MVTEEEGDPDIPAAGTPAAPQEWTNRDGQKIIASFKGVKDGKAHFVLENGRDAFYPLDRLSDESQATIRKLAEGK